MNVASRAPWSDNALCALLFFGSIAYLWYWPREFYGYDDGVFLYEAKRVFEGQAIYRDFFEIVAPGPFYLMAGLYALFGATFDTARGAMAITHGLIGVLVFVICRRLGVRTYLALAASLLHLTLAFPASSIASVHWLGTCLTLLLTAALLRGPGISAARTGMWGVLAGVWFVMQHQKALPAVIAVGAIIVLDCAWSARTSLRTGVRSAAAYAAGAVAVVLPTAVWLIGAAGVDDVARALVWHPLYNYTRTRHSKGAFGMYIPALQPLGFVIKWLPAALPVAALTMILRWRRMPPPRALLVATIMGTATFISSLYNPNYVHLAFVAAVWFPIAAALLETLITAGERIVSPIRSVAFVLGIAFIVGCGWHMADNVLARRRLYAFPVATSFGRMDVTSKNDAQLVGWLTDLFRDERATEVFCYPIFPGLYLLTGTTNPTRFQITIPDYTDRDQLEEIVATLDARQVPFVVQMMYPEIASLEPLYSYVQRQYEPIPSPFWLGGALMRRRANGGNPPGTKPLFF